MEGIVAQHIAERSGALPPITRRITVLLTGAVFPITFISVTKKLVDPTSTAPQSYL
jgi:hypothetical protein